MNLPTAFIERTSSLLSDEYEAFEQALTTPSPISIRLNKFKQINNQATTRIPWCDQGFYLEERPSFTFDPLFHAGCYYVQEASSMFVEQAITQHLDKSETVLDLCAAPGGKSTHLRSLLHDECLLVSNEINRSRSYILTENLIKWGHPNIVVTQNSPKEMGQLTHFFDAILIDAPCSGEGMFRKDHESINEWSEHNIFQCAVRQQNIIDDIWNSLKPGGLLIYSTCTYNLEENEQNISYIIDNYDAEILSINTKDEWNIKGAMGRKFSSYRFFPHKIKGEGFFLAAIRKLDSEPIRKIKQKKNKHQPPTNVISKELKSWILENEKYYFTIENNKLIALLQSSKKYVEIIAEKCNVIHKGITVGELKGRDFTPTHNLAMSIMLNRDKFQVLDVDYASAIAFLKTQSIDIAKNQPRGYILLIYHNHPIGWVKNIGDRTNNLYPNEWRIRSTNTPSEVKSFW